MSCFLPKAAKLRGATNRTSRSLIAGARAGRSMDPCFDAGSVDATHGASTPTRPNQGLARSRIATDPAFQQLCPGKHQANRKPTKDARAGRRSCRTGIETDRSLMQRWSWIPTSVPSQITADASPLRFEPSCLREIVLRTEVPK